MERLTDAEKELMEILWETGPMTLHDLTKCALGNLVSPARTETVEEDVDEPGEEIVERPSADAPVTFARRFAAGLADVVILGLFGAIELAAGVLLDQARRSGASSFELVRYRSDGDLADTSPALAEYPNTVQGVMLARVARALASEGIQPSIRYGG